MIRSILSGIAVGVIIIAGCALLRTFMVDGSLFTDGLKEPTILIGGVLCGARAASVAWQRHKKEK